jgi:hypothetical protein
VKDAGEEEEVKVINNNKEVNRPFPVSFVFRWEKRKRLENTCVFSLMGEAHTIFFFGERGTAIL